MITKVLNLIIEVKNEEHAFTMVEPYCSQLCCSRKMGGATSEVQTLREYGDKVAASVVSFRPAMSVSFGGPLPLQHLTPSTSILSPSDTLSHLKGQQLTDEHQSALNDATPKKQIRNISSYIFRFA
ncbi:hypothetical protein EVAR_29847_1 [Eumeta japonica]|uniref:Uncharacterized protein n=1 Tax=Eumeta variegata TaxID=151549 RepID=A0A4C1VVL2_EUMVA|nr:hypothetical protein EVAR_29847_1 [Eumeta japonica]